MRDATRQPATPPPARARFVGRHAELATMTAALAALDAGRGSLLLVSGEPGIGKTRLAEELAGAAVAAGVRVRWGRCHEADGRPPYWPWAQIVRSAVRDADPAALVAASDPDARPLVELIPELRAVRGPETGPPSEGDSPAPPPSLYAIAAQPSRVYAHAPPQASLDAETARFRLFQAVTALLRGMATRQPLVLVLDDVHWADLPSLLLLEFIAHELPELPIAVVVTYREVEVRRTPVVGEAIGRLCRRGSTIALAGLSVDEVSHFVSAAAGEAVPTAVAERLHAQTEGNPFFLDEIVRLFRGGGAWFSARTADLPVSQGVRAAIRQRLAPLVPPTLRVLKVAAVAGREFDVPLVAAALDGDRASVLGQLAPALDLEVVHAIAGRPGCYRFSHALVRETIYDEIPPGDRAGLHRAIAELLERRSGGAADAWLPELAHHFAEASLAGDDTRAVDYAERAGRQALRILAYEEAAEHLGRALHLIEMGAATDARRQCELLLDLGQANNRAGLGDESKRTFHRAAALARDIAASDLLARAATGLCEVGVTWAEVGRRDEEMIRVLREALSELPAHEGALRARVMARLATELLSSGPTAETEALGAQAVELARGTGDGVCLAHALLARIHCRSHPDDLELRAALIDELLALTGGRGELAVNAYLWRLGDEQHAGRASEVRHTRETLVRAAVELRQPGGLWLVHAVRVQEALLEGRFDDAERAVHAMLEQPSFKTNVEQTATAAFFLIGRERGGHGELATALAGLAAQYPAMSAWRAALAMLWADQGELDRARGEVEALAGDGLASILRDSTWLFSLSCLAEACGEAGGVEAAEVLYRALEPYASRTTMAGPLFYLAPVTYYLGVLARVRGRFTEAAAHLDAAMDSARRIGARPAVARILLARARVVEAALAAERPIAGGTSEGAARLRSEAAEIAAAAGMVAVEAAAGQAVEGGSGEALADASSASAGSPAPEARRARRAELTVEPDLCTIVYEGRTSRIKAVKGVHYLARLLASPGREHHVLELVAGGAAGDDAVPADGSLGPLLDARAKAEIGRRLELLRDEAADAECDGDGARAARARAEIDALADQVAAAVGLGGRDRRAGDASERARAAVTKALRTAIERIGRSDAALADLLARTIRTGAFCAYAPIEALEVEWSVRVVGTRRSARSRPARSS